MAPRRLAVYIVPSGLSISPWRTVTRCPARAVDLQPHPAHHVLPQIEEYTSRAGAVWP